MIHKLWIISLSTYEILKYHSRKRKKRENENIKKKNLRKIQNEEKDLEKTHNSNSNRIHNTGHNNRLYDVSLYCDLDRSRKA